MLSSSGVTFEQWKSLNNKLLWSLFILELGHPWSLVILDLWSSLISGHPWSLNILDLWSSLIFDPPWSLILLDLWSSLIFLQYILDLWISLIFEHPPCFWSLIKIVFHDSILIFLSIFSWERSTKMPTKYCQGQNQDQKT